MKIDCSCTIGAGRTIVRCPAHTVAVDAGQSVAKLGLVPLDGAECTCTVVTGRGYSAIRHCAAVHQPAYKAARRLVDLADGSKAGMTKDATDALAALATQIDAARLDATGGAAEVDSL